MLKTLCIIALLAPVTLAESTWTGNVAIRGRFQVGPSSADDIPIPSSYFGLHINAPDAPWPSIPFGSLRLWDLGAGVACPLVRPDPETWRWSGPGHDLDGWLKKAKSHGVDVMYNLGRTPQWASANPSYAGCGYDATGHGQCFAPRDLNADGTGDNQIWKDWIEGIAAHVKGLDPNVYQQNISWEVWNEFSIDRMWNAGNSNAQMARLVKDAADTLHSVNPDWRVSTPSSTNWNPPAARGVATKLQSLLEEPDVSDAIDALAFHTYMSSADPEETVKLIREIKTLVPAYVRKELWDTEFSWGAETPTVTDWDLRKAYLARKYLLLWSAGVKRAYWYGWDIVNRGQTALASKADPACVSPLMGAAGWNLCPTGVAYRQLYEWMVGRTASQRCGGPLPPAKGVWKCEFKAPDGTVSLAIWDSSQTCSGGSCSKSPYGVASTYNQCYDLEDGDCYGLADPSTHVLKSGNLLIGAKPILLQGPPQ